MAIKFLNTLTCSQVHCPFLWTSPGGLHTSSSCSSYLCLTLVLSSLYSHLLLNLVLLFIPLCYISASCLSPPASFCRKGSCPDLSILTGTLTLDPTFSLAFIQALLSYLSSQCTPGPLTCHLLLNPLLSGFFPHCAIT